MNPETENVNVQPQELQEEHFKQEEVVQEVAPEDTAAMLNEQINSMAQELIQKEEEKKQLTEKVKLAQAELVNYRKRKDEEIERMLKYSNEDIVLEILPILDNFERAIKMDDDNLDDEVSKFLQGMKMVYASLVKVLEKYEVKEIESLGKMFDAKYHQAVMTDSVEDKEKEIITEVYQKGYMLKDKLLRPAMVKVNK